MTRIAAIQTAASQDRDANLAQAEHLIRELCSPDGLVVDFFLGGGTTAAACAAVGRRFIGFEINAASIEKAAKRLAA